MKRFRSLVFTSAILVATASAADPVAIELLSDPSSWTTDLIKNVERSADCPSASVADYSRGMALGPAQSLAEFEQAVAIPGIPADHPDRVEHRHPRVSPSIGGKITPHHSIHAYHYSSDPDHGPGWWGFSGYLVAVNGCVVHAQTTHFDN